MQLGHRFALTLWIGVALAGILLRPADFGYAAAPPAVPAAAAEEPPAPAALPAVQTLLEEAVRLTAARQPGPAREAAERALGSARDVRDAPGEARAQAAWAGAWEAEGRGPEAAAAWRAAAAVWERVGDGPGQVEALAAAGRLAAVSAPAEATGLMERVLALAQREERRPLAMAMVLNDAGTVRGALGHLREARALLAAALVIRERRLPDSLDLAASLNNLGNVVYAQGDLTGGGEYYRRALALQERLAPGSLEVARSLSNLGIVTYAQGDLARSEAYFRQALAVREKRTPDSIAVAASLSGLGSVAFARGDLAAAQGHYRRAAVLRAQLAPGSMALADSLNNLGNVAHVMGDLAGAREYFQRALVLKETLAPDSLPVASSLNNLANVSFSQHDLAGAREYYQRSLAIKERRAPNSVDVAASLMGLGAVAQAQGDLARAGAAFRRVLAIQEALAPGSPAVAASLNNLGVVALKQGDVAGAQEYHRRALAIRERLAPGSVDEADSLNNLGRVALAQKDIPGARRYYQRALDQRQRLAPDALETALSLWGLGIVAWMQRDGSAAERYWSRAWRIARDQLGTVAEDEARQALGASKADYAAELRKAQLANGHRAEAFRTLEESRAQALQQLLRERKLPPSSVEPRLWAEHAAAVAARDRAEQTASRASIREALARRELQRARGMNAASAELTRCQAAAEAASQQLVEAQSAYTRARLRAAEIWETVRRSAPRAFTSPLSLPEATRALPAGTLYAAFAVGEEQTHLFLLRDGERGVPALTVFSLPLPRSRLEKRVAELRLRIRKTDPGWAATSRALGAALFPPPALTALRQARRLLISPDGPLWELPFAALVTNAGAPIRCLGDAHPLTYTPSLALFAQSHRDRPHPASGHRPLALIVGNPLFDRAPAPLTLAAAPGAVEGGAWRFLWGSDTPPEPLPGTATEAAAVAHLYGSRPLTGARAREAEVRREMARADVIHLATHGWLHPYRAMSSGILLTPPEQVPAVGETGDDGVLQAWEIYSQLKLQAELVVLSACETGRGENVRSEGIVGLTRALQTAGARSIVASQWPVADTSTARLMVTFHAGLRRGLTKDEALRRAMTALRRDPRSAHPRYWAAFALLGDPENAGLAGVRGRGSRP